MAGLDYRHAGIDYRHATSDYRGSLDATVSPAVVAAVAAVPAPTVSGAATVAAGVVAASAGVPGPTVAANASVSASVVAGVSSVGSPTVSGAANAAVSTVGVVGAVPSATASQTANAAPDTVTATGGVHVADLVRRVALPTTDSLPPLASGEVGYRPLAAKNRLARFYSPRARGVNVWIADGAVTTTQPADSSTITRTLYGGHEGPDDLTDAEAELLADAGYAINVEAA